MAPRRLAAVSLLLLLLLLGLGLCSCANVSLIDKIDCCCKLFTFAATEHHRADERELKRARLAEILAAVRSSGKAAQSQNQPPGGWTTASWRRW